jgi:hypothetical protein
MIALKSAIVSGSGIGRAKLPLIIQLEQQRADEPGDGIFVGKDG